MSVPRGNRAVDTRPEVTSDRIVGSGRHNRSNMEPGRWGKTKIGVLTVIREELAAAKVALSANTRFPGTRYWHSGDPADFVLAKMGDRSNVPAAKATQEMFEHWRPDVLLLVGIAGALDTGDAGLGDVVIADYVHYGEFRKITESGDDLRYAAYDHPTVSLRIDTSEGVADDGGWRDRVAVERPTLKADDRSGSDPDSLNAEIGAIVAGEKIYGDPDHPEQERVLTTFENAIAVDMESWGVARAVHDRRTDPDYNPRLAIVRGISDIVRRPSPTTAKPGGKTQQPSTPKASGSMTSSVVELAINSGQRKRWKAYAAATAAAFAAAIVEDILNAP